MNKPLNPNDYGKKLIVEECQRIRMTDVLQQVQPLLKRALIEAQLDVLGVNVSLLTSKTGFGGKRYWLQCSGCKKRKGVLLVHPASGVVACRICLNADYKSHRYKGMTEILD